MLKLVAVAHLVLAACSLAPGAAAADAPAIDGSSADGWKACTGWVQKRPARFEVKNDGGRLVFSAEGANTEMPWLLDLARFGFSGDERYLLVRYRAEGMAVSAGGYFLHGEEGTVGGRLYAAADQVRSDGQWHTLAVDLEAVEPAEVTHRLAIKVSVGPAGRAALAVERIWFAEDLPQGADVAPAPRRSRPTTIAIDWAATGRLVPQPGWTRTAATRFEQTTEGRAATFTVSEPGKGMRWLAALARPVDLAATPYLSLRYKASGQLAGTTYALWLGNQQSGAGRQSVAPLSAGDVQADGAWHNLALKVSATFAATHLAVGLDSAGAQARLTLDAIRFSSRPGRWTVAETLAHQCRDAAWPSGKDGFFAQRVPVAGGRPSARFLRRAELDDWFASAHLSVSGVPFEVPPSPGELRQTGTNDFGDLSLDVPAGVSEVYVLSLNSAPATEPWGIDWRHPRPQETLDVAEKVFYEIRYDSGPPERVLPLDAKKGDILLLCEAPSGPFRKKQNVPFFSRWGMRRGLGVSVVHPDRARRATKLVLHDRMQTAGFAIVGATFRRGAPRVPEPNWEHLAYRPPPVHALAAARPAAAPAAEPVVNAGVLQAAFDTTAGLGWSRLAVAGLEDALACGRGPVFEVEIGGTTLGPADWSLEKMEPIGPGRRFLLRSTKAPLAACVDCLPGDGNQLLLRMSLTNTGPQPLTATLRFPVLREVRFGSPAETWYLLGKRGGIIHSANLRCREPLGERHPMQMDGFFCPRTGLALACLTHDRAGQHHWIDAGKTGAGGCWHAEYPDRDLAPGASFTATEAALVLREGDWRAILAAYTDWLKTWFAPAAPRKAWFERVFALASGNAHYDAAGTPRERGAVRPIADAMLRHVGVCDYVHLFGWAASKQFGDWGDYDHYDETVGGLDYFRENIRRVQQDGMAVSLYLDGYLSSAKGQLAGPHARDWAIRRPDGSPQYVPAYESYNQCPYNQGWQEHLSSVYRRVQNDLHPKIMYIDEYGSTDGRWTCWAKDHGHNRGEIPYAGEVAMLRRIRQAVGPEVALYTEYPPAEVSRQYLDGSITYQALWSAGEEGLAPHFIDLPRFVFPDFKQFHIIYYVTTRAGNWWLFKFPFFNGEVYRVGVPGLPYMDEPSLAFLRRAISIQCAHRAAFASHDVAALVPTESAGVFANLFRTSKEDVWTLYNANGRSLSTTVLRVPHTPGATYADAWNGCPLRPQVADGAAAIAVELEPKGVGCVVQRLP